jgi:4-hydroxy-3-methylbut-2-enyl diphosphate reductase
MNNAEAQVDILRAKTSDPAALRVLRARPLGMCAGVRRALAAADAVEEPRAVTIAGQLVHNEAVERRLRQRGFHVAVERGACEAYETPVVLITAHGMSDLRRGRLLAAGRRLVDATCPLVRNLHRLALAMEAAGYHVLLVGRPEHAEVRGVVEDLVGGEVIADVSQVRTYPSRRLAVLCQTTVAVRLRNLRAEVRWIDTICPATCRRQQAALRLLPRVDSMVVVGGRQSNNTRELAALCRRGGVPVLHIQDAGDLRREWFEGCRTVGLSAGTSTLPETIDEVEQTLSRMPYDACTPD